MTAWAGMVMARLDESTLIRSDWALVPQLKGWREQMHDSDFTLVDEKNDATEAPAITRLGTLAELTLGGELPIGDGVGGSGASV